MYYVIIFKLCTYVCMHRFVSLYITMFAYMPLFVNPALSPLHKQIKSHIAKPLF